MQTINKYLNRLGKKKVIVIVICLIICSFVGVIGIKMMSFSSSELALAALEDSFRNDEVCHEKCSQWRLEKEKEIVGDLKNASRKIEKRIFTYWQSSLTSLDFKRELIRLLAMAYGEDNPPEYIREYMSRPELNVALLREIVTNFNSSASRNQIMKKNIYNIIKVSESGEDKVEAIKTLKIINNDSEIDAYYQLLVSSSSPELKLEIVKNISNIKDKRRLYTIYQLNEIKNLVLMQDTNEKLRQELALLLGDYFLIYPKESAVIWRSIYDDKSLDSISRSFSADSLNHLTNANLELPLVSDMEWSNYYKE